MGVIVRQSSLGIIANYFGILLGFINVMLIMPSLLSPEQIGLINLILAVVFVVYPIMDFSAAALLNRYFTNVEQKQLMLNKALTISATGAFVFIFIFLLGKPLFVRYYIQNSPEIIPYYWLIYAVSVIMGWLGLMEAYTVIHLKYHVSTFAKEVVFRVTITILLALLYLKLFPFETYIYLHFSMYGLMAILLAFYLKKKDYIQLHFRQPQLEARQRKSMLRFGGFSIFTGLAAVVAIRIDTIMLGSMEGLKDVGIYTIAMFMTSVIEIPRKTVLQSSAPIIRMAIKENNLDKVAQIQYKTILNLSLIGGFMLTILMVNLPAIYQIIPDGEIYAKGLWVVFFIGASKLAEMMAGSNQEIIISSRYYALNIIFIILLAVLTIGLNYIFIPIDGLIGSAYATLISTSIVVLCRILLFRYLFKRSVYQWENIWIFLFFAGLGAALFYLPGLLHPIVSIGIKTGTGGLIFFFFLKWTKVSPDLNELINSILRQAGVGKWVSL